jgi:hypothetical protein
MVKCPECSMVLRDDNIQRHFKEKHMELDLLYCEDPCTYKTARLKNMERHKKSLWCKR